MRWARTTTQHDSLHTWQKSPQITSWMPPNGDASVISLRCLSSCGTHSAHPRWVTSLAHPQPRSSHNNPHVPASGTRLKSWRFRPQPGPYKPSAASWTPCRASCGSDLHTTHIPSVTDVVSHRKQHTIHAARTESFGHTAPRKAVQRRAFDVAGSDARGCAHGDGAWSLVHVAKYSDGHTQQEGLARPGTAREEHVAPLLDSVHNITLLGAQHLPLLLQRHRLVAALHTRRSWRCGSRRPANDGRCRC